MMVINYEKKEKEEKTECERRFALYNNKYMCCMFVQRDRFMYFAPIELKYIKFIYEIA